ncbi:hydantoinase B/oxoprolinase family protein [Actinomadura macra]|uniref:hydantoinase B/oxoprolinase family protein n=1 Tax=Actinomadura macra TaxID=46164 RepID=UPI0008302578|nr:hydantoinase B/oxoprolinase family protein [Actinomadura macra]
MAMRIPGSERFAYRPRPRAEILDLLGGDVRLHTGTAETVDALTYEVVRHRIWAITNAMCEGLKRMSGSIIVSEVNDCGVAIMDEIGDVVQIGLFNMSQAGAIDMAVKWILENRSDNPGIAPGDMFILTDPWVGGSLHQNDVCLVAPIFHDGEIFAWAGTIAHEIDLGGVAPGSWSTKGMDVFWESLPMPPIKIVEGGRIRADVEDAYIRRSRLPALVSLDLRAKMGSNNIGTEGVGRLIGKYGAGTVKRVMRRMMDDSEQRLRARLRSLPDGSWSAVSHQDSARETDRDIHTIALTMTKRGDELTFDFSGTDPQVDGIINCTYGGLRAGILGAILPVLCGDIPWAPGGLLRPLRIVSEPGTINNCEFPHGVGKGSVASHWATAYVVVECLAGMLDSDPRPEGRETLTAVPCGAWDCVILSGLDQHDHPFVMMLGDPMAGGIGARGTGDGGDTAGLLGIPMGKIADVEMNEFLYPLLYLWRREEIDSGGPGRYRGGVGGSSCFVPHGPGSPSLHLVVSHAGKALPSAPGVSGGYPGNTGHDVLVHGARVGELLAAGRIPESVDELGGRAEIIPVHAETQIGLADAYFTQWSAGGGYGDPLLRDPLLVLRDVTAGKVGVEAAERIYGVMLTGGGIDEDATRRRRQELRAARAPGREPDRMEREGARTERRLDDNLDLAADDTVHCAHCGAAVGDRTDPTSGALLAELPARDAADQVKSDPALHTDRPVVFRRRLCPGCHTSLLAEIVPADAPGGRTKTLSTGA